MSEKTDTSATSWYALKVFYNRIALLSKIIGDEGCETFVPMQTRATVSDDGRKTVTRVPLLQSLMFFRAPASQLPSIAKAIAGNALIYSKPGDVHTPAPIMQEEMDIFRIVTGNSDGALEYLGDDTRKYSVGERVRVIGGPLAGAEGHICRIRGDKRLVVSISGVCAVATSYIPACLLQKLPNQSPL